MEYDASQQPSWRSSTHLGQGSCYESGYQPDLLHFIPRALKRAELGINVTSPLPFVGFDCWNHYEVSWLNPKGKPLVAIAEIYYDCQSPYIVESKSLKLYFNGLNNVKFNSFAEVASVVKNDLVKGIQQEVTVLIHPLSTNTISYSNLEGECLDDLEITCTDYTVNPHLLTTTSEIVSETLYSHLLKSNCLVTHQPDWGSVQITYTGHQFSKEGLLKYLISFRNHNEFHEQCIERIFTDIMKHCRPTRLSVLGRYTRRGGIDINPLRSTHPLPYVNPRLLRQ